MKITNETGTFTIDDNGVLKNYQSTQDNQVKENVWRCLDIPEGVRVIPGGAFFRCEILERLTFPKSLRVISTGDPVYAGVFSQSKLLHVELPNTLEELGYYAFASSTMRSVRIPKGPKSEYGRQFKDSRIGTLYLPEEFRNDQCGFGSSAKYESVYAYGYIYSLHNAGIGEVVFE